MKAFLYPKSDDCKFLHPTIIAQRLSSACPDDVQIDWETPREKLTQEFEILRNNQTPLPVLAGHQNLIENVVAVRFRTLDCRSSSLFFVYPDSPIEIQVDDDAIIPTIMRIAECIEYDLEFFDN